MKSLKAKLLFRITLAILVVEAILLVVSVEYHRRELVAAHQPSDVSLSYREMPEDVRGEIQQYLRDYSKRITVAIAAVVVGTIALLYFLLNPLIIRPIRRIVRANEALAAGQDDQEIAADEMPEDDLGAIMRSRARMLSRLSETQDELRELNNRLEYRVSERTAQLEETLKRLRRSQEQLIQAEKLSTMGVISASLAHEVVQPLTAIRFLFDELQHKIEDSEVQEIMIAIEQQVDAVTDIVDQFRRFSRTPRPPRPMCLNDAVRRTCPMISKVLQEAGIELQVQLDEQNPEVIGDPTLVQQMVLNLLTNAKDAFGRMKERRDKRVLVETVAQDDRVDLFVQDNGCGMPDDVRRRVFDVFFTTKDADNGTGLGLTIVRDIAQQIEAELACDSEDGRGTTFRISFKAANVVTSTATILPAHASVGGTDG